MKPESPLNRLIGRRLLIVSGKGGVGKTTTSLALGLIAAEQGKRVILAEINSEEQVSHLLERSPLGYEETELLPNLWGINIQPNPSFKEYVLLQIKFKSLYQAVFENKYVRHFIEATPGLADLMCIGKVYDLTRRYDLVIVDAPATGHGIALLEIASIVSSAVKVGPLRTEADKINSLLHDETSTNVILVTIPEEMPITEAIEMNRTLEGKLHLPVGPLILNQHQEVSLTTSERKDLERLTKQSKTSPPLRNALNLLLTRQRLSEEYLAKLHEEIADRKIVPVPFIYSPHFGLAEIQTVAGALERGLA